MTRLFNAMKEYDGIRRNALDTYAAEMKKIHKDYGDSRVGNQKLVEAMNTRDSVLAAAKKNGLEAVEQVFSELMEKIDTFVTAPVSADFPAVLEAIKTTRENLSPAEADAYMNRYGNNYTAYRSLSSLFDSLKICNVYPVTYDSILADVQQYHSWAVNFFNSRPDYMYRLFLSDDNPMKKFFENIGKFLNGDILEYGKSIPEEE